MKLCNGSNLQHFKVTTFMHNSILTNGEKQVFRHPMTQLQIKFSLAMMYCGSRPKSSIQKIGGYTVSLNHDNTVTAAEKAIQAALTLGYDHYYKIRLMLGQNLGHVRHYH
jgi:maltose phosphorylase